MISVEYLMIGEKADFQVIIDKTCMNGMINRSKSDTCLLFLEDTLQSCSLFLTIGKDIKLVALIKIFLETLEYQTEILMKNRLRVSAEGD